MYTLQNGKIKTGLLILGFKGTNWHCTQEWFQKNKCTIISWENYHSAMSISTKHEVIYVSHRDNYATNIEYMITSSVQICLFLTQHKHLNSGIKMYYYDFVTKQNFLCRPCHILTVSWGMRMGFVIVYNVMYKVLVMFFTTTKKHTEKRLLVYLFTWFMPLLYIELYSIKFNEKKLICFVIKTLWWTENHAKPSTEKSHW